MDMASKEGSIPAFFSIWDFDLNWVERVEEREDPSHEV